MWYYSWIRSFRTSVLPSYKKKQGEGRSDTIQRTVREAPAFLSHASMVLTLNDVQGLRLYRLLV